MKILTESDILIFVKGEVSVMGFRFFRLIREMDTNSVETLFERRRKFRLEIVSRRNQVALFISEFGLLKYDFFVHFMYFHQKRG